MGGLAALEDEAPDLEEVLQIDKRQTRPDAVGAERSQVFTVNLDVRAPAGRGSAVSAAEVPPIKPIGLMRWCLR